MIPKIIHQTWLTGDLPTKYLYYQKKVKELHPEWKYILWTDEDNLEFIKKNFPDFYETYIGFPKNIMRADMIRYLIMDKIGGIYLDLDYEMIKPFDYLKYDLVLPYNRSRNFGDTYDGFGNCIFGSAPGHMFWKYVINDFKEVRDYEKFYQNLISKSLVPRHFTLAEAITGPGLLTRIFYDVQNLLKDYYLPERQEFHPLIPSNEKQYNTLINDGIAYGIHHCFGSWRNKHILKKIKNKIQRFFI